MAGPRTAPADWPGWIPGRRELCAFSASAQGNTRAAPRFYKRSFRSDIASHVRKRTQTSKSRRAGLLPFRPEKTLSSCESHAIAFDKLLEAAIGVVLDSSPPALPTCSGAEELRPRNLLQCWSGAAKSMRRIPADPLRPPDFPGTDGNPSGPPAPFFDPLADHVVVGSGLR